MAYKQKIWQQSFMGDLMVLVGTVPESAGFKTFGFAGGPCRRLGTTRRYLLGTRKECGNAMRTTQSLLWRS
jgi:catalase (peroxidase I)